MYQFPNMMTPPSSGNSFDLSADSPLGLSPLSIPPMAMPVAGSKRRHHAISLDSSSPPVAFITPNVNLPVGAGVGAGGQRGQGRKVKRGAGRRDRDREREREKEDSMDVEEEGPQRKRVARR